MLSNAADPDLASRREVQRIISLLKKPSLTRHDYHAVGEQMRKLSEDPAVAQRGSNWRDRVAQAVGCSSSMLTKALQFRTVYQADELTELEALNVGWSRLTITLGVADRGQRLRLLQKAKAEGWGDRQLQRAIQQNKGWRRGGGRPRREVTSQGLLADLAELNRLTEHWLEFAERV